MSITTLRDALYATIAGLTPTGVQSCPWTRARGIRSEQDVALEFPGLPTRSVWLDIGPPVDTGLLISSTLDEVRHDITLHVVYRDSDLAWSDDGDLARLVTYEDAVQLVEALRPASVWGSDANILEVYPDTAIVELDDGDGRVIGRVLRVRITAEVTA